MSPFFLPYQWRWINDHAKLKIFEKSRQIGISFAAAYSAVRRAAQAGAIHDIWVSSRDDFQARLFLQDCKHWADYMQIVAQDLDLNALHPDLAPTTHALKFANGRSIYSLSSNPNALAGKRGHVILDEFALHQDQDLLYRVALPVTTWGGQLEIISTHRGANSLFNRILLDLKKGKNDAGWSHHRVTLSDAVDQGLVDCINRKNGSHESREDFVLRLRRQCLSDETWLQEYCCAPADLNAAFLDYDLLTACHSDDPQAGDWPLDQLRQSTTAGTLYLGADFGRYHDLTVFDLGARLSGRKEHDVVHDRLRIVLKNRPFAEIEHHLHRLLEIPNLHLACLDATGIGCQIAENAIRQYGEQRVIPLTFTAAMKEKLAFGLRADFERKSLRIARDESLRADLLAVEKSFTPDGNLQINGRTSDGHCDRFWALALRQHAVRQAPPLLTPVFLD
jgi:phage FluMu gp28-like protein